MSNKAKTLRAKAPAKELCSICSSEFKTKQILLTHMQRQHDPRYQSFQCIFCNNKYSVKGTFEEHLLLHIEERPHLCNLCPREFRYKSSLKLHLKTHKPKRVRSFRCDVCGKKYYTKGALRDHSLRHATVKGRKCEVCGKTFNILSDLNKHIEHMHTEEGKQNVCLMCDKSFSQRGSLTVHMRSHTGERPFRCRICGDNFITSSHKTKHERIHHR